MKPAVLFVAWVGLLALALWYHEKFVKAELPSPAPSASTWHDDFDTAKRDRQYDWCLAHGGVPTMTFTHAHSNVLCLDRRAVIPMPEEK